LVVVVDSISFQLPITQLPISACGCGIAGADLGGKRSRPDYSAGRRAWKGRTRSVASGAGALAANESWSGGSHCHIPLACGTDSG